MLSNLINWIVTGLAATLELLLIITLVLAIRKGHKARAKNRDLRQEREVIFDFIHNIGELFADTEDIDADTLLNRILFFATRTGKAAAGAIYLFNSDRTKLFARSVSGIFPPLYDADQINTDDLLTRSQQLETLVKTRSVSLGEGLIGSAASIGTGIIVADAEIDARVPTYSNAFLKIHSLLIVPMRFGNEVLGVMALANRTDEQRFTASDLNLLQAMADQASVPVHYAGLKAALDQKRQLDRDMRAARQIQASLLPQELPTFNNTELAAYNVPAMNIGGDYYDIIQIDDDHIGIAMADVSGKGIGGAMMMAVCQGVLRARARHEHNPAQILSELNRVLSANLAEDMFITMLYMVLNTRTRELSVARAGHESPLLKHTAPDRPAEPLSSAGIAIGLAAAEIFDTAIQDRTVQLNPGDVIVAYTDGITEALNEKSEEWGTDQLVSIIDSTAASGVEPLIDTIRSKLALHVGAQQQYDDMTLLAIKVR